MLLKINPYKLIPLLAALYLGGCATVEPQPQQPELSKEEFCEYDRVLEERLRTSKPAVPKQTVLGWVEWAKISGTAPVIKAKLDSGAETTSINAEVIREFEKDGKDYILYNLKIDENGEHVTFESPITRWVRIRTKTGGYIRRPVVELEMCVGGIPFKGEANLAERDHFNYPMLIGRNMLRDRVLVNSGTTFVAERECH